MMHPRKHLVAKNGLERRIGNSGYIRRKTRSLHQMFGRNTLLNPRYCGVFSGSVMRRLKGGDWVVVDAVSSETVSVDVFPVNWEKTGKIAKLGEFHQKTLEITT
jgi:hypothetical protein